MKFYSSSSKIFFLPQVNLYFKYSLDAKMSLEKKEIKRFKDYSIQKVQWIENLKIHFLSKREYK